MAWFNKNKKEMTPSQVEEIPSLPPLPKLPEFPADVQFKPNALPRYPSSSLGDKFSQNTIKEAISGEKEGEEEEANESEEMQTMPRLPSGPLIREFPPMPEEPMAMERSMSKPMSLPTYSAPVVRESQTRANPMFVRLDKFEENLAVFDKIKKQLAGVERIIEDIKRTKEEEDKQMAEWEEKLQTMKGQIEKIDKDIFSKIE